jgi:hypothetical protein
VFSLPQVYDFTNNIMWVSVAGPNVTDSGTIVGETAQRSSRGFST